MVPAEASPARLIALVISLFAGVLLVSLLSLVLSPSEYSGAFLLDRAAETYPFTSQDQSV